MGSKAATTQETQALDEIPEGMSPTALGTLVLVALLFYFWLSGTFFPEEGTGFFMTPTQATGSVLTYSTIPAFLIAAVRSIRRRTRAALIQLRASKTIDSQSAANVLSGSGFFSSVRQNAIITIIGLILGCFNVPWDIVLASLGGPTAFATVSIAVGNLIAWAVASHVAFRCILMSNSIRKLGRWQAKVDLFRLDALLPFGRMGTFALLIVAVAVSFSAFQALDAELRWVNYRSTLAAGVPLGIGLLLLPMIGIWQNVRIEKRRAIARVDDLIGQANRELDPESMRYLGDLLHRRERLEKVREWPLDMTGLSRIAFYFIVPPLAWLGGALVELLLNAAIDRG